jgi:hypothetical protein
MMSMQRNLFAPDRERWMCLDDFIHPMRATVRILFRAIDEIMQASYFSSSNRMELRSCNDLAAM